MVGSRVMKGVPRGAGLAAKIDGAGRSSRFLRALRALARSGGLAWPSMQHSGLRLREPSGRRCRPASGAAERRQHLADRPAQHRVGDVVERCRLVVHDHDAGARLARPRHDAGHRVDLQRRADREQQVGLARPASRGRSPRAPAPGRTRSCRSSGCRRTAGSAGRRRRRARARAPRAIGARAPQRQHITRRIVPCTSMTRSGELPPVWCSSSMFCVISACSLPRRSSATSARWPGFGCAVHAGWPSRLRQAARRTSGSAR